MFYLKIYPRNPCLKHNLEPLVYVENQKSFSSILKHSERKFTCDTHKTHTLVSNNDFTFKITNSKCEITMFFPLENAEMTMTNNDSMTDISSANVTLSEKGCQL